MSTPTIPIDRALVASAVRRIARYVSGGLATKGLISKSDVEFYSGLIVLVLTEGWSIYSDWLARREARAPLHADTPPNPAGSASSDPKP